MSIAESLAPHARGSFFLGTTLATALYGCTCGQFAYYLRRYSRTDGALLRGLIVCLWVLDTLTSVADGVSFWYYAVEHRGQPVSSLPRVSALEHLSAATAVLVVRSIDLMTLWKLAARRRCRIPLVLVATALSMIAYGSSISMLGYDSQLVRKLWEMLQQPKMKIMIQTLTAFAADVFMCAALCGVIAYEGARLAPHSATRGVIRRYTCYTIGRNLVEALVELFAFILYIGWRHNNSYYWTMIHIPSSKVYVNSVLAMFNARRSLTRCQDMSECLTDSQGSIQFATILTLVAEDPTEESGCI